MTEIKDWHDLDDVREDLDGEYELVADLDSDTDGYEEHVGDPDDGWDPIGGEFDEFTGSFDGNGHEIADLEIEARASNVGLFGNIEGRVEAVALVDAIINGIDRVGGLVGDNRGKIIECSANGDINGGQAVGSLVGQNGGEVIQCSASGDVGGSEGVGGLVGRNGAISEVVSSTASTDVDAPTSEMVGGLVGQNEPGGEVIDSSASGEVIGNVSVGGLVGENEGKVVDSASTGDISGGFNPVSSSPGGLIGRNPGGEVVNSHYNVETVEIDDEQQLTIGGLFNDQYEDWESNDKELSVADYDSLSEVDGRVKLDSEQAVQDALGFVDDPDIDWRVTSDIELTDEAAGLYLPYLAGNLEGNDHTITLDINAPDLNSVGFIGFNAGNTIQNCNITGVVTGGREVGCLVGRNFDGEVLDCSANGDVDGGTKVGGLVGLNGGTVANSKGECEVTGDEEVGGLIGENRSEVNGSEAGGTVIGNRRTGGLIGINDFNTKTVDSVASADVDGGRFSTGGLVGRNRGEVITSAANGDISGETFVGGLIGDNIDEVVRSAATGDVTGEDRVGGLVGQNSRDGKLRNTYARGAVEGDEEIGGLVGDNTNGGSVFESYATGAVEDASPAGGFVGVNGDDDDTVVAASYWDTEATGRDVGVGQDNGDTEVTGLETAEMQGSAAETNMDALDFDDTWQTVTDPDDYPILQFNEIEFVEEIEPGDIDVTVEFVIAEDIGEDDMRIRLFDRQGTSIEEDPVVVTPGQEGEATLEIDDAIVLTDNETVTAAILESGVFDPDQAFASKTTPVGEASIRFVETTESGDTDVTVEFVIAEDVGENDLRLRLFDGQDTNIEEEPSIVSSGDASEETLEIDESVSLGGGDELRAAILESGVFDLGEAFGLETMIVGRGTPVADWIDLNAIRSEVEGDYVLVNDLDADTDGYSDVVEKTASEFTETRQTSGGSPEGEEVTLGRPPLESVTAFEIGEEGSVGPVEVAITDAEAGTVALAEDVEEDFIIFEYTVPEPQFVGFTPLGSRTADRFSGTFDGQENEIRDLDINRPTAELSTGLFSRIDNGGEVKNVHLVNIAVTGETPVGGLVGGMLDGTITASSVEGTVAGERAVGGLAGRHFDSGTIDQSTANCEVTGERGVGGLVGSIRSEGTITSSVAEGDVTGNAVVGGLAGSNDATIQQVVATGSVTGDGPSVGGLVGTNEVNGTITESSAEGDVTGENGVGGLVGRNLETIEESFATGDVVGDEDVGGLVGRLGFSGLEGDEEAILRDSYWDEQMIGQDNAIGDIEEGDGTAETRGEVAGLETDQMQGAEAEDNMTELDFDDTWQTVTDPDDYPILRFQDDDDEIDEFTVGIQPKPIEQNEIATIDIESPATDTLKIDKLWTDWELSADEGDLAGGDAQNIDLPGTDTPDDGVVELAYNNEDVAVEIDIEPNHDETDPNPKYLSGEYPLDVTHNDEENEAEVSLQIENG